MRFLLHEPPTIIWSLIWTRLEASNNTPLAMAKRRELPTPWGSGWKRLSLRVGHSSLHRVLPQSSTFVGNGPVGLYSEHALIIIEPYLDKIRTIQQHAAGYDQAEGAPCAPGLRLEAPFTTDRPFESPQSSSTKLRIRGKWSSGSIQRTCVDNNRALSG